MTSQEFTPFQKIPRFYRDIIVTEKIDGTNAQILIGEDMSITAGSRNRYITPADDNYGFADWVQANRDDLLKLGPGRHFGEWWGNGIGRGYGLKERPFSLFNTVRWCMHDAVPQQIKTNDPRIVTMQDVLPECCHLVPVLYSGVMSDIFIDYSLDLPEIEGSVAAPGYMNPEGVVIFHTAANRCFKATLKNDDLPKSVGGK